MTRRWKLRPLACAGVALALGCAAAGPPIGDPGDMQENPPATRPAASSPAESQPADAVAWVDKIDAASRDTRALTADVRYLYIQGAMSDRQIRLGTLVYAAGPPARFVAQFDKLIVNGRLIQDRRKYVFDGKWLAEWHDDEKQFIKRQVVAPNAPPDQADPLTRGQGPFALPITLHKDDLLGRYNVSLIPEAPEAPAPPAGSESPLPGAVPGGAVHLRLIPKPGHAGHQAQVDIWYDKQTLLPVRATTVDDSENQSTVDLSNAKLNPPIKPEVFDTTPPGEGWDVEIKPWAE